MLLLSHRCFSEADFSASSLPCVSIVLSLRPADGLRSAASVNSFMGGKINPRWGFQKLVSRLHQRAVLVWVLVFFFCLQCNVGEMSYHFVPPMAPHLQIGWLLQPSPACLLRGYCLVYMASDQVQLDQS